MTSSQVEWSKNDEVGHLCILALSEYTKFIPDFKDPEFMYQLVSLNDEKRTAQELESLVQRLSRHLSCLEESHLPIGQDKAEMLKQCNMTNINPSELHMTKSNYVNCNQSIDALNKILFQQQLIKSNKQLSSEMIQNLQEAEPVYNTIKSKLISGQEDQHFKLINRILYKKVMVFDQESYKLCLPSFVAIDILQSEHLRNNCHLPIKTLTDRFCSLFHVPNVHEKASKVIKHA